MVRSLIEWQKKKISAAELERSYYTIITSTVPFSLLTEKTVGEGNCADLVMPDERTWTAPMIDVHFTTASKVLRQIFDQHHTEIWEDFR